MAIKWSPPSDEELARRKPAKPVKKVSPKKPSTKKG